jgi:acyl-CoA synthetase (AMP-forming)/AMP-acid ligase II
MLPRILGLGEDGGPDLSGIALLTCGGAPLAPETRAEFESRFGLHLTQGYSCTEMLGAFAMDIDGDAPPQAVGRIYPSTDDVIAIIDDQGHHLATGSTGEIAFARRFALSRYWNRPDETEEAFVDGAWYRTGDIGRVDEHGFLYVLDRKKDVIIRGGFNIYSAEIERALLEHPWVSEAYVVGVPDEQVGEVPVAFVVGRGEPIDIDALFAFAEDRLGRLKRPEAITAIHHDELPRNALGKVRKDVLRSRWASSRVPLEK